MSEDLPELMAEYPLCNHDDPSWCTWKCGMGTGIAKAARYVKRLEEENRVMREALEDLIKHEGYGTDGNEHWDNARDAIEHQRESKG